MLTGQTDRRREDAHRNRLAGGDRILTGQTDRGQDAHRDRLIGDRMLTWID